MFSTIQTIDANALLHNVQRVRAYAPHSLIMAMVKANAYGCGLTTIAPLLENHVDALGVAFLEEALQIYQIGIRAPTVIFRSFQEASAWQKAADIGAQCVIHHPEQLTSLLQTPLTPSLSVWVKIDTGMHRAGFPPNKIHEVMSALTACPWVHPRIGLMTHFSHADEPAHFYTEMQFNTFQSVAQHYSDLPLSLSNSAAIMTHPETHGDVVRPGLMLYGVSPFFQQIGREFGLLPVVQFRTKIEAIQTFPAGTPIGYHGVWQTTKTTRIGLLPVGYGDGYPREIRPNTPVWICGRMVPIVGRVSMDLITVDLTNCEATLGDSVELWGKEIPIERVAQSAGTIPYTLLTGLAPRHFSE